MVVYKFGGASVKNAEAIKNVGRIISNYGDENMVLVLSAMGKSTNALELLLTAYKKGENTKSFLQDIRAFHENIVMELFPIKNGLWAKVQDLLEQLEEAVMVKPSTSYSFDYDRIVSFGELLSTNIIHFWLNSTDVKSIWHDTRKLIITDSHHRRATVNWEDTNQAITKNLSTRACHVVQGFIGASKNGATTTLGREGSDYTAAVFAFCLEADSVTIWKDVPGVLNGDPKIFDNAIKLEQISYKEAIELAYFGASVIHPKTIQPLQRKDIPLNIRSFIRPETEPTIIKKGLDLIPSVSCFIKKTNQALLTLSTPDLAFIVENHLSQIYQKFHEMGVVVNMMQNSAVSTSFCVNQDMQILPDVINDLKKVFEVKFNKSLNLYTARHYNTQTINTLKTGKEVLLEQVSRETFQMVTRNLS